MQRSSLLLVALLLFGCGKDQSDHPGPTPSVATQEKKPPAKGKPSEEKKTAFERITVTSADFLTDRMLEHLSPKREPIAEEPKPTPFNPEHTESSEKHPQKRFTRVKGGDGYYCGATIEGPIECWGRRADRIDGKFLDLAIAGDELCWIDMGNRLSCDKKPAPEGSFSRVQASGENFCALDTKGSVTCWGKDAAQPLPGMKAQFIAVGDHFACAADITRNLVCWGETMPLLLPIDPLPVRDIAAGAEFLCALTEDNEVQCFGKGPRLPEGRYTTLNAAYDQLCGITVDAKSVCVGTVESPFPGQTRRFAIARKSVCAHLMKNELACQGQSSHGQLKIPRNTTKTIARPGDKPATIDGEAWLKFIELFPQEKLPQEFNFRSKISLGDRVPPEYEVLLNGDPNRYRTGVGFELPHGVLGFTLFDLEERSLVLFLLKDRRKVDDFALLRLTRENGELLEAEDGTGIRERTATSRESILTSDQTIESIELKGTEKSKFVKKHLDGSRPISSIDCQIEKSNWVNVVTASGKAERRQAKLKREYGAVDGKGCAGRSPFE